MLRYDLYRWGYSDRPKVRYDQDLFIRQLRELLVDLEIGPPVDLAGMSLGGLISVVFTDLHPEWVRKLIFFDPVGFEVVLPTEAKLVQAPILGEVIMKVFGESVILRELPK